MVFDVCVKNGIKCSNFGLGIRVFMLFLSPFEGEALLFFEPLVDYNSGFDNIKVSNLLVQTNFNSTYLVMFQFGPRAFQTSFSLEDKQFSSNSMA